MTRQEELSKFWQHIFAAYFSGKTALPPYLGLSEKRFSHMVAELDNLTQTKTEKINHHDDKRQIYQTLISLKDDELKELSTLLTGNANQTSCYVEEAVRVITCACMGSDHLWSDLGLPERPVLGEMINFYLPELHKKNTNNMRWKRFFYKQLCEQGGDYVCRAPSCEACSSYKECFV